MVGDGFRSLADIRGIQYRDGDEPVINPPAFEPVDLDQIPSPYLENSVFIPSGSPLGFMIDPVRGCAGHCTFCFEALRTHRPRAFSPERVKAEVKWALSRNHTSFHLNSFVTGIELLQRIGESISLYLIYGLPGDNFREFMRGVCFADSLGASTVFLNRLCVLDDTPLRREAETYQLEYCPHPPYQVLSNSTYSFHEIAQSESFAHNYRRFHRPGPSPSLPR